MYVTAMIITFYFVNLELSLSIPILNISFKVLLEVYVSVNKNY